MEWILKLFIFFFTSWALDCKGDDMENVVLSCEIRVFKLIKKFSINFERKEEIYLGKTTNIILNLT